MTDQAPQTRPPICRSISCFIQPSLANKTPRCLNFSARGRNTPTTHTHFCCFRSNECLWILSFFISLSSLSYSENIFLRMTHIVHLIIQALKPHICFFIDIFVVYPFPQIHLFVFRAAFHYLHCTLKQYCFSHVLISTTCMRKKKLFERFVIFCQRHISSNFKSNSKQPSSTWQIGTFNMNM